MTSGLRRFVGAAPRPQPAEPAPERCELCDAEVPAEHGHVVDIEQHSLLCACRACYLLVTSPESGAGRRRAVPERYLHDPEHPLSKAEWDGLGIPVSSAFFLRSDEGTTSAFYPSPAGATECLLDLAAWAALTETHPLLAAAAPAVEAILVRRTDDDVVHTALVPIDACYELVGIVRVFWQGFDGGAEAKSRIEEFFAGLNDRMRRLDSAGAR